MVACVRCGHDQADHGYAWGCDAPISARYPAPDIGELVCPCPRYEQQAGPLLRAAKRVMR